MVMRHNTPYNRFTKDGLKAWVVSDRYKTVRNIETNLSSPDFGTVGRAMKPLQSHSDFTVRAAKYVPECTSGIGPVWIKNYAQQAECGGKDTIGDGKLET